MSNTLNVRIGKTFITLYLIWIILHLLTSIKQMFSVLDYSSMDLSDMLINYQAGFVRRGLLGELLYRLYVICSYDVGIVVLTMILLSAIVCLSLLAMSYRKLSVSPVLLFSGFSLQFMALASVCGIRRDYLTLSLCLLSFYLYRRGVSSSSRKWVWLLLCQGSMILSVLLHEGAWFYTAPILCLHYFYWSHRHHLSSWVNSILRSCCFVLPVAIVMMAIYMNKGTIEMAHQIWDSWKPLFVTYPRQGTISPELGGSVYCLSCTIMDFVEGCSRADWGLFYWGWLPMFPLTLLLFPALIYLVTRANESGVISGKPSRQVNIRLFTTIMLVQLIAMVPFFLFLSCDYGRLFCYWMISTVFAFWIFNKDEDCFPDWIKHLSDKFQSCISACPLLLTPMGYALVLVLTPCNMVGGAALGAIPLYRMFNELPSLIMEFL